MSSHLKVPICVVVIKAGTPSLSAFSVHRHLNFFFFFLFFKNLHQFGQHITMRGFASHMGISGLSNVY